MEDKVFCFYEFEDFRLDPRRRALSKNGEKVPLSARNFDLLLFMVENGGRILEHDELLDKVWAGTFVEQATLKKGISALRHILVEKPETEFIKTIPRRGYSFVSPVRVVPDEIETLYIRETESEIIVEEYEETDETEKIIEPHASAKALNAANPKKINVGRTAIISVGVIGVAVLVFFGIKTFFFNNIQPQFSVENVRINRITNSGKLIDTAISPDGNYLLYPASDKDGVSLWLRQMSVNSTRRLTKPMNAGFWAMAFAPDNSYIYYVLNNKDAPQNPSGLYKIPLLGDEPRKIHENVSSIAISPDGNTIAAVRLNDKTNIFTINTDGEAERTVSVLPRDLQLLGFTWTPDGTALLCSIRKVIENKPQYYVAEISVENGSETIILPPQEKIISSAVRLPDKSALLLTMREPNADVRQIWQYLPASSEWRRVTNDNNSYEYVNLTRDGKTILSKQASRLASIWVTDDLPIAKSNADKTSLLNSAGNFRQITDGTGSFDRLGWLANNRIMYSTTEDRKELVFTMNGDGTNPRQITGGEDGIWIFPSVAGNGQNICFLSNRNGRKQGWRVDEDGRNLTKLTQTDSNVFTARLLRDNSTVLLTMQGTDGVFLFKQLTDGQIAQLTDSATGAFAVSPDETLLAVEMFDKTSGKTRVELRSLADGQTSKTFDFDAWRELTFTPDGKNLAYDTGRGGIAQIMIQPLDGGEAFVLTEFPNDQIFSFGWSPDGKHLAVIRGKQLNDAVLIKADNR